MHRTTLLNTIGIHIDIEWKCGKKKKNIYILTRNHTCHLLRKQNVFLWQVTLSLYEGDWLIEYCLTSSNVCQKGWGTKGVTRSWKSEKDRQSNGLKQKGKTMISELIEGVRRICFIVYIDSMKSTSWNCRWNFSAMCVLARVKGTSEANCFLRNFSLSLWVLIYFFYFSVCSVD